MKIRPATLYLFVVLAFVIGCSFLLPGCAHVKTALRTLDQIATDACLLFAADHPEEFGMLVQRAAPASAPKDPAGFNPRILCAVKEVLQPFLDDQLRLQRETAISLRAAQPTGWRPAGADSSLE